MENLKTKIKKYIEENLPDYFFMEWHYSEPQGMIELYLDSREGISIDECSKIARELSEKFPELGEYAFIVSSPGLDKPMTRAFQLERNINRMVKVYNKENGEEFFGKLTEVNFPNFKVRKYKQHKKQIKPTREEKELTLSENIIIKVKI